MVNQYVRATIGARIIYDDDIKAKINSDFDTFLQQLAHLVDPPIKDSQNYDNLKKKYTEMKQRINVMFDNSLREITGLAIQPIDTYVESDVTSSSTGVFKVGNVSTVES